jgi:hypothetical protein
VGEKRNLLIGQSKSEYIWFVDDDDVVEPCAITEISEAIKTGVDVITYNGYMTTDGKNREDFEIKIGSLYETETRNGKRFYKRFPNHICPMKRAIAESVKFEHVNYQEDYKFAKELNDRGLLKTSVHIDKDIYHYRYRTKK